jgi:hypothetical protein
MKTELPLKRVTQHRPADLLPLLGVAAVEVPGVETLELPTSSTRLDTLLGLREADGQAYLHLVEWQGSRRSILVARAGLFVLVRAASRRTSDFGNASLFAARRRCRARD